MTARLKLMGPIPSELTWRAVSFSAPASMRAPPRGSRYRRSAPPGGTFSPNRSRPSHSEEIADALISVPGQGGRGGSAGEAPVLQARRFTG